MVVVLALGLLAVSGCAEKPKPAVDVTGQVLLNGEPFSGVAVRFYNPDLGGAGFNLDEQGNFASKTPLTVGEYLVSFDFPVAETEGIGIDPEQHRLNEVPEKYRSTAKSGLAAQLMLNGDNNFVFRLQGKGTSGKLSAPTAIPVIQ